MSRRKSRKGICDPSKMGIWFVAWLIVNEEAIKKKIRRLAKRPINPKILKNFTNPYLKIQIETHSISPLTNRRVTNGSRAWLLRAIAIVNNYRGANGSDSEDDNPTIIKLPIIEGRKDALRLMLDNGATVNLLKVSTVADNVEVFTNSRLTLGDTGLRRRSHPINPMSAIPEETASTTVLTDEIEEQESPVDALPLVDPRYSALRQDFTCTEMSSDEITAQETKKKSYTEGTDIYTAQRAIIITAPPTTDSNISIGEDTTEGTEEIFTQLSDAELLKAATEINTSQRLINQKSAEFEDLTNEEELEGAELANKTYFSEGDQADEATRDYLDSIDTFDERNFTDKTLTEKVNRLVTQALYATDDSQILRGGDGNISNIQRTNNTNNRPVMETPKFKSTPLPQRITDQQSSKGIQKLQDDTPVVLNFTQPPITDCPIFIPIPIDETPINQYKPAYITTDNISDKEETDLKSHNHNITISRNSLTYKRDNYIHFISQDCGPYTKNSRLLSDIGAIDYKRNSISKTSNRSNIVDQT
ncbi:unnamed protein product [Trichogramma brassicae]|uniref:Uncharacterized protein n=1 Tax=Trichogramma brassicae TaxID=86971 RepID=A0A6H5I3G9_9HYME|nr:unnamed protein product [Trichogramma brassicae]